MSNGLFYRILTLRTLVTLVLITFCIVYIFNGVVQIGISLFGFSSKKKKTKKRGSGKIEQTYRVGKIGQNRKQEEEKKIKNIIEQANIAIESEDRALYEKVLSEGVRIFPENDIILEKLGNYYFEKGQRPKAYASLHKILLKDSNNHKLMWQIGTIHMHLGETNKAKIAMQKALEAEPENILYMSGMSEVYYAEKNLDSAIKQIKNILRYRPSDIKYLIALATLYEEIDDKEKAQLYYRRAHSLDPYNSFVKSKLL